MKEDPNINEKLRIIFLVYVICMAIMVAMLVLINLTIKYEENEKKKENSIQRYNCSWTARNSGGLHQGWNYQGHPAPGGQRNNHS